MSIRVRVFFKYRIVALENLKQPKKFVHHLLLSFLVVKQAIDENNEMRGIKKREQQQVKPVFVG